VEPDAERIDAGGGTIMPGLVEGAFSSDVFQRRALEDLDIKYPVEYVTLLAAANAKLALECATPRPRSGGSSSQHRRLAQEGSTRTSAQSRACRRAAAKSCGVGGLMDWNPDFRKIGMEGSCSSSTAPIKLARPFGNW